MKKFVMKIELKNDNFCPDPTNEVLRILRGYIKTIVAYEELADFPLFDTNGNKVGYAMVIEEENDQDV